MRGPAAAVDLAPHLKDEQPAGAAGNATVVAAQTAREWVRTSATATGAAAATTAAMEDHTVAAVATVVADTACCLKYLKEAQHPKKVCILLPLMLGSTRGSI